MIKCLCFLILSLLYGISYSRQIEFDLDKPSGNTLYDSLLEKNDWISKYDPFLVPSLGANWRDRILSVGDKVNDLTIGEIVLNGEGIMGLNDSRGKLLILDFWTTWCTPCLKRMPDMERLQKKFQNKIRVVFVNMLESEEKVRQVFKRLNLHVKCPVVLASKELLASFPTQTVPYHIWIDSTMTVRLKGTSRNTTDKKIESLLRGEEITFLTDNNFSAAFDVTIPYYKVIGYSIPQTDYFSFFTKYNNNYAPQSASSIVTGYVDSLKGTIRNTFVNSTVVDMYKFAFRNEIASSKNVIVSPFWSEIDLSAIDSLSITDNFAPVSNLSEVDYLRNKFCYEQIASLPLNKKDLDKKMQGDLNSYFGHRVGVVGNLLKIKQKGKKITRKETKLTSLSKMSIAKQAKDTFEIYGIQVMRYKDVSLNLLLKKDLKLRESFIKQYPGEYLIDGLNNFKEGVIALPISKSFQLVSRVLSLQGIVFEDTIIDKSILRMENSEHNLSANSHKHYAQ